MSAARTLLAACAAAALWAAAPAMAAGGAAPPAQHWSFSGLFGAFDKAQLRRGLVVYKEVCSVCHGLRLVAYRNLAEIGFSEAEVKAIAASVEVEDGPDEEGEMFERPGKPSDRFKSPFPNENAARAANNGALPPDLSLAVKSHLGGADYVHGVLTGYGEAPAGMKMPEGMSYNSVFAGGMIAMPPPLSDDGVEYADGMKATTAQQALDVTAFLAWAAEPELEERKRVGAKTVLFLLLLTGLLYVLKRRVWAGVH